MRRVVTIAAAALALSLLPASASPSAPARDLHVSGGIGLRLPGGWQLVDLPLTTCLDPKQRLAAATFRMPVLGPKAGSVPATGVLVLLLEDTVNSPKGFAPRPNRFHLPSRPTRFEGCCDMPTGPGYSFTFRDGGRDFEAYVFAGRRAPRPLVEQAAEIVNGLRIAY